MTTPSNIPGGRYASLDDNQRSGQVLYGDDDQPQIVARGTLETDGLGGVTLLGGKGITSVALEVSGQVSVVLQYPQQNTDYVLLSGQYATVSPPRFITFSNKAVQGFNVGMRDGTGTPFDLNTNAAVLSFAVCKA